jgi:hypothetical protein
MKGPKFMPTTRLISRSHFSAHHGLSNLMMLACATVAIIVVTAGCKSETRTALPASVDTAAKKADPKMTARDIEDEIFYLQVAVNEYRARMGAFPLKPSEIEQGIRRMYPQWKENQADCKAAGLDFSKLDGKKALVFWLGGLRESPSSRNLIGFSMNPNHPLEPGNRGLHSVSFQFKPDRLIESDGWLEYIAVLPDGKQATYKFDGKDVTLPGFLDSKEQKR